MNKEIQEQLEKLFETKLIVSYDSREDNNEDEELGHFVCYEPEESITPEMSGCPPIICIYEGDHLQFFHDATPYPTAKNSREEARSMMQTLNPFPTPMEDVTKDDYDNFIEAIKDNY